MDLDIKHRTDKLDAEDLKNGQKTAVQLFETMKTGQRKASGLNQMMRL